MAPDLAMSQASDQKAEDDVQEAESQPEHRRMGGHRQREGHQSEDDEQAAHHGDEPRDPGDRRRARREHRAAVEQQPHARDDVGLAGRSKDQSQHGAREKRGTQAEQKFSDRSQVARVSTLHDLPRHQGAADRGSETTIAARTPMMPMTMPAMPGTSIELDDSMDARM